MNLPKWFRLAKIEADKSAFKFKVGAVVVKGGSKISSGFNSVRFCSIGVKNYTKWAESLHAERAALSKMNKEDIKGCSIYVYREGNNGRPLNSMPCPQCMHMLVELGIKKIFYTHHEYPYYKEIKMGKRGPKPKIKTDDTPSSNDVTSSPEIIEYKIISESETLYSIKNPDDYIIGKYHDRLRNLKTNNPKKKYYLIVNRTTIFE